jgi:hypothetical protein
MTDTTAFDWGALGETVWKELQEATGASDLQLKFAVLRFGGATATKAAKLAGYQGDSESIRRAGYSALRSTAVQNLLELASVKAPADPRISKREVIAKISKLCRSSDPLVALKAVAVLQDFEKAEKASGEAPDDDGLNDARLCRDMLTGESGASAWMLIYKSQRRDMGHPGNYPLLHDVYTLARGEVFGQQIFDWCGRNMNEESRKDLEKKLADKNYQLEVRQRLWSEIGIKLEPNGSFGRSGSHAA